MADKLKSVIRSFKYHEAEGSGRISKPQHSKPKSTVKSSPYAGMKDLPPSLADNLKVIFVGYNPGVESSAQQHHYAHFTNLFWKLFNESGLFLAATSRKDRQDAFVQALVDVSDGTEVTRFRPEHDYRLAAYKIGFTDLVLRCTKAASELTTSEKLQNVPRLIAEFNQTGAQSVVFIGKGIWEIVVRYLGAETGRPAKLAKGFEWGLQKEGASHDYNALLKHFHSLLPPNTAVYVFPNTSGLAASMKYKEKLLLWKDLVADMRRYVH